MKIKQTLAHAWRMASREFSTGEYRLTIFALVVGVTAVMSLSLTASRIEKAMFTQAADFIGGDLVVSSSQWQNNNLQENANSANLQSSLSISITSMVGNANDEFLLSSLRAVDDYYPLKGSLTVKNKLQDPSIIVQEAPKPGNAWVDRRFLQRLNLNLGDQVDVGYARLTLTKLLEVEPDRGGNFYSFNPRLLFNRSDINKTRLIQPGSHVHYKLMLAGTPESLSQWQTLSEPKLDSSARLVTPKSSQTRISKNLDRASSFINLGSLLSVILCGIAVSVAASRHARRHINQVAVLRCFGLTSRRVNIIYSLQLLVVAVPSIIVGMIFGYFIHTVLVQILAEFFTTSLPSASLKAWFSGPLTALCMIIGFGLPAVIQLAKTPPARVLRREFTATQKAPILSGILALISLSLIAWWQTANLPLALMSVSGTILLIAIIIVIILVLLKLISKRKFSNPMLRGAFFNLSARPFLTAMQVAGFGISSFAIVLILLFRGDLFDQWQQEIPENAPNRFVFNILDHDKQAFEDLLVSENIQTQLYPIVRGRLTRINDQLVQQAVTKEKNDSDSQDEALNRDLALTQVSTLPDDNAIIKGEFHHQLPSGDNDFIPVSVESELAQNLDLKLNDQLEFLIEGQTINATITSFRSVNWENFKPNFYMLFPDKALDQFSRNWLTSYYLPKEKSAFDSVLNKTFAATTVVDVDYVINRIRRILSQATAAMELIFSMTVLAGISVFWASLLITFDEKQKQAALFRALGASRQNISRRLILEYVLIGVFSGLLASICLLVVSWLISVKVLEINWHFPLFYSVSMPFFLAALLCALSAIQLKKIVQTSPAQILQKAEMA